MSISISRFLPAIVSATLVIPARGQVPLNPPKPHISHIPQPYTAEFKITTVRTLGNGTTITRQETEIDALDSHGRHLRSVTEETPALGREPGTSVNVNDPDGGTQSQWDSRTKKAHVTILPPQEQRQGCWANDTGNLRMSWNEGPRPGAPVNPAAALPGGGVMAPAPRHKPEVEELGTTTIQGVEARGRRMTTTIPAGEAGNDQPLVTVAEYWSSPQIGLTLRESSDSPRTGKRTRELVNLNLSEPDPSLFQPPEGYEVKTDELHQVACANDR